jgi:hypothetical protein
MDYFRAIYKILRYVEKQIDVEEFDGGAFCAERFGLAETRWRHLLAILAGEGFLEGVTVDRAADGSTMLSLSTPTITLKGLEYLQENSLMRKAAKLAKGVADVVK